MPWGRFALGLLIVFLLQTTLVRFVSVPAIDLFLTYALLIAFVAPLVDARIAGLIVGLTQDLGSDEGLGTHAFALGVAAVILTKLRGLGQSGPLWVRWLLGVLAGAAALLLVSLHAAFWRGATIASWWQELQLILLTAGIAAAVAAYLAPATTFRGRFATARR